MNSEMIMMGLPCVTTPISSTRFGCFSLLKDGDEQERKCINKEGNQQDHELLQYGNNPIEC